jgi:hypothetical protein
MFAQRLGLPNLRGVDIGIKLLEFLPLSWRESFPSFSAPSPISRKRAEEERPLISRVIAQKSTAA